MKGDMTQGNTSSLRAVGDSKTPLVFLIISCVLNGALCVLFVAILRFGVAGSAIATVIAQGISSLLCVAYVYTKIPMLSLKRENLTIDKGLLKLSLQYSWVTALQQTCLYLGKLLVQGVVNPFGTNAIAAYNSVTRIDSFAVAPGDSFSSSVATFSAQNKGAEKTDRIVAGLIIFWGAQGIMKLFVSSDEKEVIQIVIRVVLSYILAPHFGIISVCYAIASGWAVMLVYTTCSYKSHFKASEAKINTAEKSA